jgi:ABC-type Fe3+ transport system substrate-binding protein
MAVNIAGTLKKSAPVRWIKNPDPWAARSAALRIAKNPPRPNSAKLLIEFMLSNYAAEVLARENRIPPGRGDFSGLDPLRKKIQVEKIVALSIKELQRH